MARCSLARTFFFCVLFYITFTFAQVPPPMISNPSTHSNATLTCRPFGTCEPCPDDALHEPFCRPFGNRRLVHCVPSTTPDDSLLFPATSSLNPHDYPPNPSHSITRVQPSVSTGETPAWESCGRIPARERADFFEFVGCNIALAFVALIVLFARERRLKMMHARMLAARIGLVRATPAGWTDG